MSDPREAGALILSSIEIFNEAVKLFENVVDIEFWEAVSSQIKDVAEKKDMMGEFENMESDWWLAPNAWSIDSDEREPTQAKFWLTNEGDFHYLIAAFCSPQCGSAGFRFVVNHSNFGGKAAWNKYAQDWSIEKEISNYVKQLEELGFGVRSKGEFFLPVKLNPADLAEAYRNEDYEKALKPIIEALDILHQSVDLFKKILDNAPRIQVVNNSTPEETST